MNSTRNEPLSYKRKLGRGDERREHECPCNAPEMKGVKEEEQGRSDALEVGLLSSCQTMKYLSGQI